MYPGFGKASGPTGPPGSQPLVGNFGGGRPPSPSPPTTPPFSGAAPLRSPSRGPEAPGQLYSPPLGFERVLPAASQPYPSAGVYRLHSPPLAFERARPAASHPHPSAGVHRHAFPSSEMDSKLLDHAELRSPQEPSLVSPLDGSYATGRNFPLKHDNGQVSKRTRLILARDHLIAACLPDDMQAATPQALWRVCLFSLE